MPVKQIVGATTVALLAMTLGACGGDDPDGSRPDGGGPDGVSDVQAEGPLLGPVDELWNAAIGSAADANADLVALDEAVARCMAEQGFEYTPVTLADIPAPAGVGQSGLDVDTERDTLAYAQEHGYGLLGGPDGAGLGGLAPSGEWSDPNQPYLDTLTEAEYQAYRDALYGVLPNFTTEEEWAAWVPSWEEQGCTGRANHEVYGDQAADPDEVVSWEALEAELGRLYESIDGDPRVTDVVAEWSACMADAGYPGLATVRDAEQSIVDRALAVWQEAYQDGAPVEGEDASEVDGRLADLAGEEVATAVADHRCRAEVGYWTVRNEVSLARQQEFYDANRADLEAYSEYLGASGG